MRDFFNLRIKKYFLTFNYIRMSQNLERLFALEGGAKRRGAKKGSKKASKGKKAMRGGALTYDECIAGIVQKDAIADTVTFEGATPSDLAAINASLGQSYAGQSNPFCKDLKAAYQAAQIKHADALKKSRAATVVSCASAAKSSPVSLLNETNFNKFVKRNGAACGPVNGLTLNEVKAQKGGKRKSKKASKGSKKAQKGGAKKGSKKASKGKKGSR
jgi:hypothetical protein